RLQCFPHRFATELHDRLDEVAITFVQNALLLARLDQSVYRFGGALRLLVGVLLGQGGYRLAEAQSQGKRQHQIVEKTQQEHKVSEPPPPGAGKENKG